eukprot:scaffold1.g5326.t1
MSSYFSGLWGTKKEEEEEEARLSPEDAACMADWGLTLRQEAVLVQQLRDEIEMEVELAPMWDDYVLRRFLRARKHDIVKAKRMFLEHLEWRKQNDVEEVLEGYNFHEKEQFHKYYPEGERSGRFYGVDREGRPVYLQLPGKIDTEELWKFTTLERSIRYHIQQQERYWRIIAPSASVAAGVKHEASTVLIDLDGKGGAARAHAAPKAFPRGSPPAAGVEQQQRASSSASSAGSPALGSVSPSATSPRSVGRMPSLKKKLSIFRRRSSTADEGSASPTTADPGSPTSPQASHASRSHFHLPSFSRQHKRGGGIGGLSKGGSNFAALGLRGWPTMQSLLLVDAKGVGISTITGEVRKIMGMIMQIDQDQYPELMWKCLIVNAPTTFRVIWGMVKYLLDARTQAKIEVLPADFQPELLKYIAHEQLPTQYGGTCAESLMAEPGPWRDDRTLAKVRELQQSRLELQLPPEAAAPAPAAAAANGPAAAEVAAAAMVAS